MPAGQILGLSKAQYHSYAKDLKTLRKCIDDAIDSYSTFHPASFAAGKRIKTILLLRITNAHDRRLGHYRLFLESDMELEALGSKLLLEWQAYFDACKLTVTPPVMEPMRF